jgi:UPF0755 protein
MTTFRWAAGVFLIIIICGLMIAILGSVAPGNFPQGTIVSIPKNATLSGAAQTLSDNRVIRSMFMYKAWVVLLGGHRSVMVGDYLFDSPQSALRVAYRTIRGEQGISRLKITIPEGSSSKDIAWIILKQIPKFDAPAFQALAREHEGYLFPETYFFYENVRPQQVIDEMLATFDDAYSTIAGDVASSTISKRDLITMASIVEREGISKEDREIIAGILWKRIKAGMALQVDAPFYYLFNKPSSELTLDDLKIDSPYNTYVHAGLPPGPISNPGMEAIVDTLNPVKTPYWYYLSGKDGKMHYAVDLEGHVENKRKYL